MATKIIIMGDTHCGHYAGLTPPGWRVRRAAKPGLHKLQKDSWDAYCRTLDEIDYDPETAKLILMGDMIDGKGSRSGGVEQLTTDLFEQANMAVDVIDRTGVKDIFMVYGTPYHVSAGGVSEDIEQVVAQETGALADDELYLNIEGVVFHVRHHTTSSSLPQSKATGILRERALNSLAAANKECPQADVILRGHTHKFCAIDDGRALSILVPALQTNSRYGVRKCSGSIDWGMISMDVDKGAVVQWSKHLVNIKQPGKKVVKV